MIKLKVPKNNKKGLPETVNQGNFQTELKPGGSVETESREFADWLIREFDLEEALPATAVKETEGETE